MRIYIAAKYGKMVEMRGYAERLRGAGHEVTSRWIDGDEEGQSQIAAALMDVDDVTRADCVLSFTEPLRSLNSGGGRHFEFGLATALGKRLLVVGHREIVFHHLPQVEFYENFEDCLAALAPGNCGG